MDTLGLPLAVLVQAASVQDPVGAAPVLAEAKARAPNLLLLWADARYQGPLVAMAAAAAVLGLVLLTGSAAQAQTTLPAPVGEVRLSLADAVARLRTESPELAVARLDVQKAAVGGQLADRARWPTLNGFGQYQHNFKPPVIFFPAVTADPATGGLAFSTDKFQTIDAAPRHVYNAGVNLTLPLFQRELALNRQLAATEYALRGQGLRTATAQQVADVQRLYLRTLLVQGQQQIARGTLANARQHLREVRGLHRQQLALDSDTLRAFVALANARAPLARLERTAQTLHADLATRLALPPGAALVLTDSLTAPRAAAAAGPPPAETAAVDQALTRRPELKQLDLTADLNRQQVAVARARSLPSLALYGQYSTASQASEFTFNNLKWPQTAYVGLQLTVPIFNATNPLRAEQARLTARQTEQQRRALTTQVAGEVRTGRAALTAAQDQLAVQELTVRAAGRGYQLVHQRWRLGLAKFTELADAEEQLNQARANRLQARYDYRTAEIDCQQAAGPAD